ncbi:MAG: TonB family protein [Bacteroidales bacterium]|nr:TonB family protein [Bacteroidales bacterium]MDD4209035.1 TonB family protein [Bacteroidales bacterium]
MIKKSLLLFTWIFLLGNIMFAQQNDSINNTINYPTKQIDASFKGGLSAMVFFIDENIQLPATKKGMKGTVLINISMNAEGKIVESTILSGINKEIDQAVLDVIKKMPNWNPASVNGIAIPSKQVIGYNISY